MSLPPILVPSFIDIIYVDIVGSVKYGSHNTLFNPMKVPSWTILMYHDFSTNKKCARLSNSSPLMIQLFIHTFKTFSFYLSAIYVSLDLFCALVKRVPSPLFQGCCLSLTDFLNSSGHIKSVI